MAKQDEYTRYTIRVPSKLYERLQSAAGDASVNAEIIRRLELSFQLDRELPIASMALDEMEAGIAQQREMFDLTKELVEEVKGLREIVGHIAEHGLAPEIQDGLKRLVQSQGKGNKN
ncbi:MAG TPA: hypothetical protein VGV07_22380 [Devosia sp.]|jgi:hypothetical protein|uniref:hypothetical protein n=1 Tax=Devosia sp. TaxID=1871048 RepID=UPI002DDCDDFC|nr:hypothetical protein [Devosia sp.]HEV2518015.1 hypothetical protein [Devosia sp.]